MKNTKKKSKWQETLKLYQKLKEEDRLDEIEPMPEEVHERVVRAVVKNL
ncbi:MAG: hypothetical protein OXD42_11905 [Rhodospirillaceae bacterium]|nr:hypothetical protein [Rhodospirillaceae bacterium]